MPNSLKARLKKLKYQGVLSQEDIDRIVILPNAEKVTKNETTMTNEEAITYANCLKNNYTINFEDMADFCDTAIKALAQEPCEDVIERNKLYGLAEEIRCVMCTNSMKSDRGCDGGCQVDKDMYNRVMETIKKYTESER